MHTSVYTHSLFICNTVFLFNHSSLVFQLSMEISNLARLVPKRHQKPPIFGFSAVELQSITTVTASMWVLDIKKSDKYSTLLLLGYVTTDKQKSLKGNLDIMSFPCGYVLYVQAVFGCKKEQTDVLLHILKMCSDETFIGKYFL